MEMMEIIIMEEMITTITMVVMITIKVEIIAIITTTIAKIIIQQIHRALILKEIRNRQ